MEPTAWKSSENGIRATPRGKDAGFIERRLDVAIRKGSINDIVDKRQEFRAETSAGNSLVYRDVMFVGEVGPLRGDTTSRNYKQPSRANARRRLKARSGAKDGDLTGSVRNDGARV